jgi:phage-related protein
MFKTVSFRMLADHAKSLARWIQDDVEFCPALIGADRVSMVSVVDTVAEVCEAVDAKLSAPAENTYDHNVQSDVRSLSDLIISTVYTLNSASEEGRTVISHDALQMAVSGSLDAARTLRLRNAQVAEMTAPATVAAHAAPKPRSGRSSGRTSNR